MLQTLSDFDRRATILFLDGVGAFDLISRNAMTARLSHLDEGDKVASVREIRLQQQINFFCVGGGDVGTVHHISQGKGGVNKRTR